jgi:predicted RNA-binding protein YlxR (DUF448 family)
VTPDVAAKLPGRGAWVRADRASLEQAARRAASRAVSRSRSKFPRGLATLVETLLARRCLDQLGLARRAGAIAMSAPRKSTPRSAQNQPLC